MTQGIIVIILFNVLATDIFMLKLWLDIKRQNERELDHIKDIRAFIYYNSTDPIASLEGRVTAIEHKATTSDEGDTP